MRTKLFIMLLALLVLACEEKYEPDIEPQTAALVFEGLITNQTQAHVVTISRSVTFNDDKQFEGVAGFQVQIEELDGPVFSLEEVGLGRYVTEAHVQGQVNKAYRLSAVGPDGKVYRSAYERLEPVASIGLLSGALHQEHRIVKLTGGRYAEEVTGGIQVMVDADLRGYASFCRYEYDIVFQTLQVYPTFPFSTFCYVASPATSVSVDFIALANGYLSSGIVKQQAVVWITDEQMNAHHPLDSMELDPDGQPVFHPAKIDYQDRGFVIRVHQFSLTETAYRFWQSLQGQADARGKLFDPVESRIEGNVHCVQDSAETVFGYFGASAVTSKSQYFFHPYLDHLVTKPVGSFPELPGAVSAYAPMDFWVANNK